MQNPLPFLIKPHRKHPHHTWLREVPDEGNGIVIRITHESKNTRAAKGFSRFRERGGLLLRWLGRRSDARGIPAERERCGSPPAWQKYMPHRTIRDAEGVSWEVWEVRPAWAERRVSERRGGIEDSTALDLQFRISRDARMGRDRRQTAENRPRVGQGLEAGWLVFSSAYEKRRLAPIPASWESLEDERLAELSRNAMSIPKQRGRLIE